MEGKNVLILGALGQIGSEFVYSLKNRHPEHNIIPTDIVNSYIANYEKLDIRDKDDLFHAAFDFDIDEIYVFASLLSVKSEENPKKAWEVNMNGLRNVLDVCVDIDEELKHEKRAVKLFWPSSIAAFGPTTPKHTPQDTIMVPNTIYGVTKVAGELLCNYYFEKYGLDVRSLRFPGILSYKTDCGGGTTDYAVEMARDAVKKKQYECFVREDTMLPLMYIDDCLRSMHELMEAPAEKINVRTSYNVAGASFTAKALEMEIKKYIPDFKCEYKPDPKRQGIADSWPQVIDDVKAKKDWGWEHRFDLEKTVERMIAGFLEKR